MRHLLCAASLLALSTPAFAPDQTASDAETPARDGGANLIPVRGFDRFQVPLPIDGIQVYLSAGNRLDYGRFSAAARNLFDRYHVLTDGFPEPGRSLFVGLRARY